MQFTLRAYFHAESVNKLCIFFFNSRKINLKKILRKIHILCYAAKWVNAMTTIWDGRPPSDWTQSEFDFNLLTIVSLYTHWRFWQRARLSRRGNYKVWVSWRFGIESWVLFWFLNHYGACHWICIGGEGPKWRYEKLLIGITEWYRFATVWHIHKSE